MSQTVISDLSFCNLVSPHPCSSSARSPTPDCLNCHSHLHPVPLLGAVPLVVLWRIWRFNWQKCSCMVPDGPNPQVVAASSLGLEEAQSGDWQMLWLFLCVGILGLQTVVLLLVRLMVWFMLFVNSECYPTSLPLNFTRVVYNWLVFEAV